MRRALGTKEALAAEATVVVDVCVADDTKEVFVQFVAVLARIFLSLLKSFSRSSSGTGALVGEDFCSTSLSFLRPAHRESAAIGSEGVWRKKRGTFQMRWSRTERESLLPPLVCPFHPASPSKGGGGTSLGSSSHQAHFSPDVPCLFSTPPHTPSDKGCRRRAPSLGSLTQENFFPERKRGSVAPPGSFEKPF